GAFLNRVLDLAALGLLVGLAAVLLPQDLIARSRHAFNGVLAAGAIAIVLSAAAAAVLRAWWSSDRLKRFVKQHAAALESLRRPGGMAIPLAMSIGIQFGFLALTDWITSASGLRLPLAA